MLRPAVVIDFVVHEHLDHLKDVYILRQQRIVL